jgi:hypothetical protein
VTVVDDHPYAAYTEQAEYFDVGLGKLDEVLPAFTAGLLAAAGRLLAVLAYRDAVECRDRPFRRRSPTAIRRVLAWLPKECDRQDLAFRLQVARAFDDLAADVEAGRAPLPRCTGERRALEIMIECAPRLLACTDDELRQLGVAVPDADSDYDYHPPYWEELWSEFITADAEFSIPQAQPIDEEHEAPEPPREGWAAPRFWFSPYGITRPRDPDRGNPAWVQTALDGGPVVEPDRHGVTLAADLFSATERVDPWRAYTDDSRGHVETMVLAEILTPLGARLLQAAATELVTVGYEEVIAYGDRPWNRDEDDDLTDTFLGLLPPVCDGQNAAWRLAMVRAVADLADDLRGGCAPLPRCNAEEIALHLILHQAGVLVDDLDDADLAGYYGLPARAAFTVRHRQFSRMRETFLQDEDVLMFYDLDVADVAADPNHVAMQYLHVGDIRPVCWWWTFGNLRPRDAARGYPAWVLDRLRTSSPALRFADPADTPRTETTEPAPPLPAGLIEEFERFVGLAQHRFFDRSCAVAMARSLARTLILVLDTPELSVHRVWMLRERAVIGDEMLIVDRAFTIDGNRQTWRLTADQTDQEARSWALRLLADCAAQVIHQYATAAPELLLGMENTTPPCVDPALPQRVDRRLGALGRATTLAGMLRHRRRALGLEIPDVAAAAIMPATMVAAWEAGSTATASQLIRCAPALQMPETTLVAASHGTRDPGYWPLPPIRTPPAGPTVG